MTTITTRSGKGSPLTNDEVDANFTNLNTDKVETSGDSMTGNLSFGDNNKVILGSGNDLQLYHDGSGSYIDDQGTGPIRIRSGVGGALRFQDLDGDDLINAISNGAVTLYHNNSAKLATTSTGIDVTGVITTDGMTTSADINFGDNDKAIFGAGSDLNIYHNPSVGSIIEDTGAGALFLRGSNSVQIETTAGVDMLLASEGGAVTAYHNGSAKLATTSTGIDVTGTVTADGLTVDGDASVAGTTGVTADNGTITTGKDSASSRTHWSMNNPNGEVAKWDSNGTDLLHFITDEYKVYTAGNKAFEIDGNGDISFYEDTGTTAKLFWDASAESLGIGTSSPADTLSVVNLGSSGTGVQISSGTAIGDLRFKARTEAYNGILSVYDSGSNEDVRISAHSGVATYFNSGSNVGIGTDSPSQLLEISGATAPAIRLNDTTYNQYAEISTANAGSLILKADVGNGGTGSTYIGFEVDGANEAMRIDSSGNVGIGTSSPARLLHVNSGTENLVARFESTDTATAIEFKDSTGTVTLETRNDFRFKSGSTINAIIDTSGNVGIGTSSPRTLLHVTGLTGDDDPALGSSAAPVFISNTANSYGLNIGVNNAGSGWLQAQSNTASTAYNLLLNPLGGNVGIGTSSPSSILTAVSGASADETVLTIANDYSTADAAGDASGLMFQLYRSYASSLNDAAFVKAEKEQAWDAGGDRDSALTFGTRSGSTEPTERMRIDSSGQVKIHTPITNGFFGLSLQYNNTDTADFKVNQATGQIKIGGSATGYYPTFWSNNTERMRIDSSGNLLVGCTSGGAKVVTEAVPTGTAYLAKWSATGGSALYLEVGGSAVGTITCTASATAYNTSSDQRLKDNIVDAPSASDDIDAIQVRSFDWKADGSHQKYGMVAQELQGVAPEAVSEGATEEEMMGVDYSKLVPMLVKEIQSLRARVAQLETN